MFWYRIYNCLSNQIFYEIIIFLHFSKSALWPLPISGYNGANESRIGFSMSLALSLYDKEYKKIHIRNGTEIEMWIPRDPALDEPSRDFISIEKNNLNEFKTIYFNVYVHNASVFLNIYPKSDKNISFIVLINFMKNGRLNKSTYDYSSTLNSKGINKTLELQLNRTQINGYNAKISFRIKQIVNDLNYSSSINETFDYEYYIYALGCFVFDEKSRKWSSDGMELINDSNYKYTHCKSKHLGTYAGGYSDGSSLIHEDVSFKEINDLTVSIVSSLILSSFIILFIWAGYRDMTDSVKVGITNLDDNDVSDKFKYKITVFTGDRFNSQTDSNVIISIYGDVDEMNPRALIDSKRKLFRCGSIDCFILTTNKLIGNIDYIKIWHDNTGRGNSASWYLNHIVVDDLQTNKKYYFICHKWLAVEKDDCKIERVLVPKGSLRESDFFNTIKANLERILRDSVLPTSILYKPTMSMFTHVERVACLFLILSITIFCITMFTDSSIFSNDQKISAFSLGPYDIQEEHVSS